MDFDFTDEQRMIKDSVDRLIADAYDFDARKKYAQSEQGFSSEVWSQYAELGLLALPFAESDGGFGGGPVETMLVMEALGRALALEPYFATIILCGGLLRHAASPAQRAALIPAIASGQCKMAFAHMERAARYDLGYVAASAKKDGGDFVLNGEKSLVLHGGCADKLIVSARVNGAPNDRDGLALFVIDASAPGVTRRSYATQDGARAAEISFVNVRASAADALGEPGAAFSAIARVGDEAIAALCAEAVGCMEVMNADTVEYLKTRKQFGMAIGGFQALQHRGADMFVALEQARSITLYATMMAAWDDACERSKAMSAAKAQVGRSARFIGQQAIQLHGGVGMTFELKVGHYFKRTTMIDLAYGDADHHLAKLAAAGGLIAA